MLTRYPGFSQDALPLAKRWLNQCEANHKLCNTLPVAATPFTPTRLLFVGDSVPRLRSCSASDRAIPVRYAALSHCWGFLNDPICLTTDNLVAFQKEIPQSALCKTFRDAIDVTKSLGLDFLWIDSLCIIQNDSEDCKCLARTFPHPNLPLGLQLEELE